MGCTASKQQNTAEDKQPNLPKTQSVGKSENGKAPVRETVNGASKAVSKVNNIDAKATRKEDNNINSPRESLEIIVTEKEKPRAALSKRTSIKTQRKSKELNQVMPAWGKKTSTTESNFLEDFRLHRNTTSSVPLYEKEYETFGVDDTSMFIDGTESEDLTQSSVGDILNNLSHPIVQHRRVEQSEESFDVSKIIDVEKFRAANVMEHKEISNNHEDTKTNGNEEDLTIKTEYSQETCELNSSIQDKNTTEKEKSFTGLYNEDDNNLIDSIEREFLLTHDNFLPGQIIN